MLQITVPAAKLWDEQNEVFVSNTKETTLQLEHSLISISKWESKWHKPFLSEREQKTTEEMLDYVQCMILNHSYDPNVIHAFTKKNWDDINEYINNPMTATTFSDGIGSKWNKRKQFLTSELIYYYMTAFNIPFECQKWHLNRLLTLIHVCSAKNEPAKKVGKGAQTKNYAALNRARRAQSHSRG